MYEDSAQKIVEKILQLTTFSDRQVLEIGCGSGRITSLLAGHTKQLIGIDPDPDLIGQARSELPGVDFRLAKGEALPFSDNSFDLVLFTLSLHHQDSSAALSEATRVLKSDGRILVVEPAEDGEVEQFFTMVHDEIKAKKQAQRAIRQSGLILERSEIISAQWLFDSDDELCRSLFDYYDMPFDDATAQKILGLLGTRQTARPIVLTDILVIQSLGKPA
jgi:ubiquinone/menaquinone biosynthesis C-methylase UbiE